MAGDGALDQVRGRHRRGRQSMGQTSRRHALISQSSRAQERLGKRYDAFPLLIGVCVCVRLRACTRTHGWVCVSAHTRVGVCVRAKVGVCAWVRAQ